MHNFSDKDTYTLYYDIAEKQLAYVQFIYPENSFELPEEAYFTPRYISNDNRYLIDWEQPENDNNPVLILVEPSCRISSIGTINKTRPQQGLFDNKSS